MSDSEDKSSKTEFPTEKKISDAVEKGNLPVSREAPILASLLAIMAFIALQAREGVQRLLLSLQTTFENPLQWDLDTSADALHVLHMLAREAVWFILPAAGLFVAGGVISSVLQNPPQINIERIRPKWSNVSPASRTAAMPPCAHAVDPPVSEPLASTTTLRVSASASAAVSPAAPDPMTRMSCW